MYYIISNTFSIAQNTINSENIFMWELYSDLEMRIIMTNSRKM
jgi:hypothetical protein